MYSILIYCPVEMLKIHKFLHNLTSTQSPRTIIQGTVNIIESAKVKKRKDRKKIGDFYQSLDNIFHFHNNFFVPLMPDLSITPSAKLHEKFQSNYMKNARIYAPKAQAVSVFLAASSE